MKYSLDAKIVEVIKKDKRGISCREYQLRRERLNRQGMRVEMSLPPMEEDTDFLCVNLKVLEDLTYLGSTRWHYFHICMHVNITCFMIANDFGS